MSTGGHDGDGLPQLVEEQQALGLFGEGPTHGLVEDEEDERAEDDGDDEEDHYDEDRSPEQPAPQHGLGRVVGPVHVASESSLRDPLGAGGPVPAQRDQVEAEVDQPRQAQQVQHVVVAVLDPHPVHVVVVPHLVTVQRRIWYEHYYYPFK